MEQWGGKWDGTMGVANRVTGTAVQGCAGYYVSKALTSSQRPYEQVQCCTFFSSIMVRWSELGVTRH